MIPVGEKAVSNPSFKNESWSLNKITLCICSFSYVHMKVNISEPLELTGRVANVKYHLCACMEEGNTAKKGCGITKQPGPAEALKQMLFRLQAVEAELHRQQLSLVASTATDRLHTEEYPVKQVRAVPPRVKSLLIKKRFFLKDILDQYISFFVQCLCNKKII